MRIYKIANNLPITMTSDQMLDFIVDNGLTDWQGVIDYNDAKTMANSANKWELTDIPLILFEWVADSTYANKSINLPPIVLFNYGEYEILDGKHRIGMAKDRGEEKIKVYLGSS
jgi:hypothetical protein